jgi:tight adherence protein C
MNVYLLGGIVGSGIVFFGILMAIVSLRVIRNQGVDQRMQDFVVEYGDSGRLDTGYRTIQEKYTETFLSRTIVPILKAVIRFFSRFAPTVASEDLNRKLSITGNPLGMRSLEFTGLRILILVVAILFAVLINLPGKGQVRLALLGGVGFLVVGFLFPVAWLESRVRKCQNEVRTGLPDALDMLSVCAFAGLGFDQSLQRVSEYWHTALGNEFRRVVQEMELGVSRADALRNLSNRMQVSELSSFVAVIIQAENLGMRIADVLHGQAEQMRVIRQFKAKEIANQLPAKMIVPLALLILPALFAVIFSPMVPSLLNLFGNM